MSMKNTPADSRPREKLLTRGAGALSDAELLAILLRTGIVGKPVFALIAGAQANPLPVGVQGERANAVGNAGDDNVVL